MKTKLTFLLAFTFLFLFSCSEQKPKPQIRTIENPKVRESFENFVMPIIKSLEVDKLQKWGFGPYYDPINEKSSNEFKVEVEPGALESGGLMSGFVYLSGSIKMREDGYHFLQWLFLDFIKLSHNEPWKLITRGGYINNILAENSPTHSPEVHVYIKSKFETIEEAEYLSILY